MVERKNFAIRRFSIIFLNTVSYIGLAIVNIFFPVFFSFFVSMIYFLQPAAPAADENLPDDTL
jgi:hypothetical protein